MLPCTQGDIVSPMSCAFSCILVFLKTIIWSYEICELDAQTIRNSWGMARISPATWNVDFALVDDEREKNKMQKESDGLGALVSMLQLGDDKMSIETYNPMEGEELLS